MDMLDIARDFFRLILGWSPPHIRLLVEAFAAVFGNFFYGRELLLLFSRLYSPSISRRTPASALLFVRPPRRERMMSAIVRL